MTRRICVIPPADLLPDAGSTLYSRLLAQTLADAGCDVTMICARLHPEIAVPTLIAPIPLRHPFDHQHCLPAEVFADAIGVTTTTVLSQWQPRPGDIIHAIYAGYTAVAAGIIAALGGTITVVSELGRMVNLAAGRDRDRRVAALALDRADRVIAATAEIAAKLRDELGVAPARLTTLPVPADLSGFRARASARSIDRDPEAPLTVTTICSCLTPEKGVLDLVEAFARVRARLARAVRLTIVGADPIPGEPFLREVDQRITALGLATTVTLTGYQPHVDLPDVLAAADVYVDPRWVGNFSSVVAEAMATRCPIVASAVSSNTGWLEDGRDAVLFEPRDIGSLAAALERLLTDDELRSALARQSERWSTRYAADLSPARHAADVQRVYEQAADQAMSHALSA